MGTKWLCDEPALLLTPVMLSEAKHLGKIFASLRVTIVLLQSC
jgi:hypothetical protein